MSFGQPESIYFVMRYVVLVANDVVTEYYVLVAKDVVLFVVKSVVKDVVPIVLEYAGKWVR
jgi:hypothetical protein